MTETELKTYEENLLAHGYRRYLQAKTATQTSREWMKTLDDVTISFRIWDYEKYRQGDGYEIDACLVRGIKFTRADLVLTNPDGIERTENIAKQFSKITL